MLQTQSGRQRGMDEETPSQHQLRVLSSSPAQPYMRPLGLTLRKSASLLEWLNKKLSEQGTITKNPIWYLIDVNPSISISCIIVRSPSIGRGNMCTGVGCLGKPHRGAYLQGKPLLWTPSNYLRWPHHGLPEAARRQSRRYIISTSCTSNTSRTSYVGGGSQHDVPNGRHMVCKHENARHRHRRQYKVPPP